MPGAQSSSPALGERHVECGSSVQPLAMSVSTSHFERAPGFLGTLSLMQMQTPYMPYSVSSTVNQTRRPLSRVTTGSPV